MQRKIEKEVLLEKWEKTLNATSEYIPEIKDPKKKVLTAVLLENYSQLDEKTVTGDIAKYEPVLVPLMRRIVPELIAYDIVGVQPMTGPTGLIFAIKALYGGDSDTVGKMDSSNSFALILDTSDAGNEVDLTTLNEGDTLTSNLGGTDANKCVIVAVNEGVTATKGVFLCKLTAGTVDAFNATQLVSVGNTYDANNDILISAKETNEALYNRVFVNYSGPYASATAEGLSTNIKEMGLDIIKSSVESKTRLLKAKFSHELAEDMKSLHGADAKVELMNIMSYEIVAEINREIVNEVNTAAKAGGTYSYNFSSTSDGRWSVEKFHNLYTMINKVANDIAITTRRGRGNFVIAHSDVITALESAGRFKDMAPIGNLDGGAVSYAGTLTNGMKVYRDTFATEVYFTVGYKGPTSYDAGIFYCPHIPLQLAETIGEEDMQPRIGFRTRYAIGYSPYGKENYYRYVAVNFSNFFTTGSFA